MPRTIIHTTEVMTPPPAYSQAVRCAGLVFVSGAMAHDPVTGKIVGETTREQTAQCLRNISAVLKAAGTSLDRAVSATVILADDADLAEVNAEWVTWFPKDPPARQGAKFPIRAPGVLISVALIAEA